MELTLTTRWVEQKQREETKEVQHGMQIEYYGNSVSKCSYGIITEKDGVFTIDWEDIETPTIIDGSDRCNSILKDCGFGF